MSGRDKNTAAVAANLKRAVRGPATELAKAVKQAAKRSK